MITLSAKEKLDPILLAIPNVVGVGIRKGNLAVYVKKITDEIISEISSEVSIEDKGFSLKQYKIMIIKTSEAIFYQERTDKWRPAPGGVSIGHKDITAGTLGVTVIDNVSKRRVILSNNHVLANSDSIQNPLVNKGDIIYQQGPYDSEEKSTSPIAYLERWIPWDEEGYNYVDCAIATPISDTYLRDDILNLGIPTGVAEAIEGTIVKKMGRTTGLTSGTIVDVSWSGSVSGITYKNQIRIEGEENIVLGGDSGSVVLNENNEIVGLLFAGPRDEPYNFYIANKMTEVATKLNISVEQFPLVYQDLKLTKEGYYDYKEKFTIAEGETKDFNINLEPIAPPCNCTPWQDAECISETQRRQTRTCDPSGCDVEERIVDDAGCSTEPPPKKKFPYWTLLGIPLIAIPLLAKGEKKKK